jgi:hypothetical protein
MIFYIIIGHRAGVTKYKLYLILTVIVATLDTYNVYVSSSYLLCSENNFISR